MSTILLALGGNVAGRWGPPGAALARAQIELRRHGVRIAAASAVWRTRPLGVFRQPEFHNAVIAVTTGRSPAALLRLCKRLEGAAGRRGGGARNGPRPLDLDLICHGKRVVGWPVRGRGRGKLILPHPEAHRRDFVLRPLLEVAPDWVHPVLRRSARDLLNRLQTDPGRVTAAGSSGACRL